MLRAAYETRYDSVEWDSYYKYEPNEEDYCEEDYEGDYADEAYEADRDDAWERELESME